MPCHNNSITQINLNNKLIFLGCPRFSHRPQRLDENEFAAGVALVLIIALALSLVLFTDSSKQMTAQLSTEKEAYLYLLDEILEEAYLPDHYLDITAASNSYFDDEFVEFVVPLGDQFNSV
ncbi:hypothetical protein LCGC14_2911390 [marine sediment metagenome]|uniref:Uncharacterized protein n=1 Tax=marine sediment metagenome TaxID=412755 RepID=A0A0F8YD99_9ZZZZ